MTKMNYILELYADWAFEIFGEDIETQWGNDFGVYPTEDIAGSLIEIGTLITEENEKNLPAFFREHFNPYRLDEVLIFSLCFLHECGHIATQGVPRIEQWEGITPDEYRALPQEFAADKWAADYINSAPMGWSYWQNRIQNAYDDVSPEELMEWAKRRDS